MTNSNWSVSPSIQQRTHRLNSSSTNKSVIIVPRNGPFLGNQEAIYELAIGVYLNAFEDQTAEGGFLHSTSVVLVDWDGHIRSRSDDLGNIVGSYDVLEVTQLNNLEDDIKVLIAEYERDKHNAKDE